MSGGAGVYWHDEFDIPKMELLTAAYEGNIRKVGELLRNGVHIDSCDDDHVTALQIAAFNGNNQMVLYLLDEGADLEMCNQVGMTPFHHACREGRMTVVETLLQRGADIHRTTLMGATALTLAAAGTHMEVVKKLVSLRVEVSPKTNTGLCPTPLIAAAFRSSPQICGFLNHRGAPIDETLESLLGLSALSCVLLCSSPSVFCALLDLGADPTKKTLKQKTVAELAEQFKRTYALAILRDKSRIRHHERIQVVDIRHLIAEDQLDSTEFFCRKDAQFTDGTTPLMFAAAIGNSRAVRRLLDERVEVNSTEAKYELNALQISSLLRFDDITAMLLMGGTSLSSYNGLLLTAFDMYISGTEEPDPNLRAMLHCYRPIAVDGKLSLSSSTTTLSKVLQTGKTKEWLSKFSSQLGITTDTPSETTPIEMRQWMDCRIRASPTYGRNHKKLVTVDEILLRKRNVAPLKMTTYDTFLEVVKDMAADCQSFMVNCFYDYYNGDGKRVKIDSTTDHSPPEHYDTAQLYSTQCGYQKKPTRRQAINPRDSIIVHKRDSSDSTDRRKTRTLSFYESPSQNQMRTTPRMLKKSRESMVLDERCDSPGRSGVHPYTNIHHEQLRKTSSTPHLVQVPTVLGSSHTSLRMALNQIEKRKTIESLIWSELRRNDMGQYVDLFVKEEIDGETFLTLEDHDLFNIGITSADHRRAILRVQKYFLNIH